MDRRTLLRLAPAGLAASFVATSLPGTARAATQAGDLPALRFDHVSLNVRAFDDMVSWYRDTLGFEVEVAWRVEALDGKRLAYLRLGDTRLELVEADPGGIGLPEAESFLDHFDRTGYGHLCFAVEDIDPLFDTLATRGIEIFIRPETYDLDGTPYRRRVGFVKDPEGNVLEYGEPLHRAD